MPNFNQSTREMMQFMKLGLPVARATATLPQTTNGSLFTISGGIVLMTAILGEVTTAVGAADNTKLTAYPTVATAGDTDLCTTVDIDTCDVGDLLSITGTPGDAMLVAHKGAVQTMGSLGVYLQQGTLDLDCDASTTGAIKWIIWYVPAEAGAYITSA
jgi:hypothetical protein